MLIITRSMGMDALVQAVQGRRAAIWTCRTCARLCHGLGGDDAAHRLAEYLRSRGIDVVGAASTSACCLWSKVSSAMEKAPFQDAEVIIPLTCDVASLLLEEFTELPRLDCTRTWGRGYLNGEGEPILVSMDGQGKPRLQRPKDLDDGRALTGPYV